jgi:integrase
MEHEPGAREFLGSKSRKSKATQRTYAAGLLAFHNFLDVKFTGYSIDSIIKPLQTKEIDVYKLLDAFVSYLMRAKHPQTQMPLATRTIDIYMTAVKSYLEYNDIDLVIRKFKERVTMPDMNTEDEEALDAADIRKILLSCNNRRLKPYLMVLASGGLRAVEACAIRICDIDFETSPTKVHVRKQFAKTRNARDIYISDEATKYLKEWLAWKYRERKYPTKWGQPLIQPVIQPDDLVFTHYKQIVSPQAIYPKLRNEFVRVLETVDFNKRKEGITRRTITLHSFRRYVKTVCSNQVSEDYSEWFLGHSKSSYYTMKEQMKREIYANQCMKYLTFLDYTTLETTGKSIEKKLVEAQAEIEQLKKQTKLNEKDKEIEQLKSEQRKMIEAINSSAEKINVLTKYLLELTEGKKGDMEAIEEIKEQLNAELAH